MRRWKAPPEEVSKPSIFDVADLAEELEAEDADGSDPAGPTFRHRDPLDDAVSLEDVDIDDLPVTDVGDAEHLPPKETPMLAATCPKGHTRIRDSRGHLRCEVCRLETLAAKKLNVTPNLEPVPPALRHVRDPNLELATTKPIVYVDDTPPKYRRDAGPVVRSALERAKLLADQAREIRAALISERDALAERIDEINEALDDVAGFYDKRKPKPKGK